MNLELIKKEAAKFFPPKRYPFGLAFSQDDVVAFAKHCVEKSTRWRPIEEAPKDGTEIDVWNGHERIADVSWRHPSGYASGSMDWCTCSYERNHGDVFYWVSGVTHYMNKPTAPEAA